MSRDSLHIRRVTTADAERIAEIYNWYIANTVVTFETIPVSSQEMQRRIHDTLVRYDWIVGAWEGRLVGYAYYNSFRARTAYNHTVEATVYLSDNATGKGFGTALYTSLLDSVSSRQFHEVIGVIALPNPASLALHRALGFHEVGILQNVGYKFDRYVDVGIWQRSL
jgi:phosphinothricin acetyltransferase